MKKLKRIQHPKAGRKIFRGILEVKKERNKKIYMKKQ
jgi:hypothetical protein